MNKKIERTKQVLLKALLNLIAVKNIKEITVSELCKKARINRTTFYKYYSIPVDILQEFADEIFLRIADIVTEKSDPDFIRSTEINMLKYCKMLYENQEIMRAYMLYAFDFLSVKNSFFRTESIKVNTMRTFLQGGATAITMHWVLEDFAQTPEEIASILSEYIIRLSR